MYIGQTIKILDPLLHLTYVQNTGAAFNLFEGRYAFLMIVPFCALLFAVWYMEKHRDAHSSLHLALILIISGGIGNLIDRVTIGFVTDMFAFGFWPTFPVFNLADIAICLGCFFLVIYIFFFDKAQEGEPCNADTQHGE